MGGTRLGSSPPGIARRAACLGPAGAGECRDPTGPGPARPAARLPGLPPPATSRPAGFGALTCAQAWTGEQPPALAVFRAWTDYFPNPGTVAARSGLEPEGVALARTRRAALRLLIETDPLATLDATVPAALRLQWPAAIVAELETRFFRRR